VVGRETLVEAAGDARLLEQLMSAGVTNGGLWFDDADCAKEFGKPGDVPNDRIGAFAKCVAALRMEASARENELGDVVVMKHAPGFELEARVIQDASGPRLTWIGFASRRPGDPDAPTLTHETLEAHRLTGDRDGPLEAGVAALLAKQEATWVKVCLDATGAPTRADAYETTSTTASRAFVAAAKTWTFRPFMLRGQAVPACALVRMAYPPGSAPAVETLPLPPPPSRGKQAPIVLAPGSKLVEGKRIAGNRLIAPDDDVTKQMRYAKIDRIQGWFRVCIDEGGVVESVLPLRSTGYASYDARIMGEMHDWKYSPYLIDDQPVPVCTRIVFVYSQGHRPR
jgi:hypothetical protein